MHSQELDLFYQARTCHKGWSMRLEAFTKGLPVDLTIESEMAASCFVDDIKAFFPLVTSHPCFSEFQTLYAEVHQLIQQQIKSKGKIGKKKAVILSPKLIRLVQYFDELAIVLEKQVHDTHKAKNQAKHKTTQKKSRIDPSQAASQPKKKRKAKEHSDIMDELEQSMRKLDELL